MFHMVQRTIAQMAAHMLTLDDLLSQMCCWHGAVQLLSADRATLPPSERTNLVSCVLNMSSRTHPETACHQAQIEEISMEVDECWEGLRMITVKYSQGRASRAALGTTNAAVLIHWQTSSVSISVANRFRLSFLRYAICSLSIKDCALYIRHESSGVLPSMLY